MNKRVPIPIPTQAAVLFRDRWLCHLCGRPVILHLALKYLEAYVASRIPDVPVTYWQANWRRDAAPLLDELAASVDHVVPHSRGGSDDPSNLAAVCARCNARKGARSDDDYLKEKRPWKVRGKYGDPQHWDGLSAAFVTLAREDTTRLSRSEKNWLEAIELELTKLAERSAIAPDATRTSDGE